MISVNDFKKDIIFLFDGAPHRILEVHHKKMARQGASVQTKLKNLISGTTLSRNFTSAARFEEVDIVHKQLIFLYEHRGEYVFVDPEDRSERFILKEDRLEGEKDFLKSNLEVAAHFMGDEIIQIVLPIKVDYRVIEAPPGLKGNTVSGGNKQVVIETGARIQTPLFIEEGDFIRVNTQRGEYAERVSKGT